MVLELVAAVTDGSCSNITIDSCSVIASSKYGAGIGGSNNGGSGSNITINSGSVTASSTDGAGIGGGDYGGLAIILPLIVVL